MDNHIVILSGISGSGKSTLARKMAKDQGYIRVNRDELRQMLFGYTEEDVYQYYTTSGIRHKESLVTELQDLIIQQALDLDRNVVIDNTNLKMKYIEHFKKFGAPLRCRLVPCDLDEAIGRDILRKRSVGREIIKKQWKDLQNLKNTRIFVSCDDCGTTEHVGMASTGDVRFNKRLCLNCSTQSHNNNYKHWSLIDHKNN